MKIQRFIYLEHMRVCLPEWRNGDRVFLPRGERYAELGVRMTCPECHEILATLEYGMRLCGCCAVPP